MSETRPDPLELLRQISAGGRRRAFLRVYLGYARGCGATTAMLAEATRRAGRGTDVVLGAYQIHDEPAQALGSLRPLRGGPRPPRLLSLDLVAALARNPEVICVDDLAALDTRGRPVFDALPELLSAGITVLATLHVLSVRHAASEVAGAREGPVLDESVMTVMDEMEVVDLPPEDLLRRLRERPVMSPSQLAQAMQAELRPQVLRILREASLRIIADHADRQLQAYLPEAATPLEFRGRIVLCLPPRPGFDERIRSVAHHASRQDAKLVVVSVRTRRLPVEATAALGGYATLTHQLGGTFVRLDGRSVARTLARFIADTQATEVVLGHRRRRRRSPWDTTSELIRRLTGVDIHILGAARQD